MIAWLSGRLRRKDPSRTIVETGGVGYLLQVPISTLFALGEVGSNVELFVHTHVREDAISLFGFATELELHLFERLLAVTGIGPKLAVSALSGLGPEALLAAIGNGDARRIAAVPGLGRKTSERIVLELRDRIGELAPASPAPARAAGRADERGDALSALLNLGYRRKEAEAALDRAEKTAGAGLEAWLKGALALLGR